MLVCLTVRKSVRSIRHTSCVRLPNQMTLVVFETWLLREVLTVFQVILTGHVPPGYTTPRKVRWMTKVLNQKFVDVILRHSDVIVAMHFGHEHHDSFRLFYNEESMHIQTCF